MYKFKNVFFNPFVQTFFVLLAISLMYLYLFKDKYSFVNLQGIFNDFYPSKKLDSRMLFTIDIEGCSLRGVYEGDDFKDVKASGANPECKKYEYSVGDDPNEFRNKLISSSFIEKNRSI